MTTVASVVSQAPVVLEKRPSKELDTKIAALAFDFDAIMRQLLLGLDQSLFHVTLSIPYSVFQNISFEELKELVVRSMRVKEYSDQQIETAVSILKESYLHCLSHSPVSICASTLENDLHELLMITTPEYFFQQLEVAKEATSCVNILDLPQDKIDVYLAQLSALSAYLMRIQGLLWYLDQPNLQTHIMDYASAGKKDVMRTFLPTVYNNFSGFCSQLRVMATMRLDSSIQELQERIHLLNTLRSVLPGPNESVEANEVDLYEDHDQGFDNAFIRIIRDALLLSISRLKEEGNENTKLLTVLNQALSRHPTCTVRDILKVEDPSDVLTDRLVSEVWDFFTNTTIEDMVLLVLANLSQVDLDALDDALELIDKNCMQALNADGKHARSTIMHVYQFQKDETCHQALTKVIGMKPFEELIEWCES